ncbi:hypothetical protein DPMN_166254 [Dreissena polymorpha]|uniref:Uncharacterized protein n=1 Tax=Dreissena polymorpha TaxID=45954 RepID=A0A9D4EYB6_DREPO|nr:hypothetical protein DPMN_166254 [Dreissena polymorpha]
MMVPFKVNVMSIELPPVLDVNIAPRDIDVAREELRLVDGYFRRLGTALYHHAVWKNGKFAMCTVS